MSDPKNEVLECAVCDLPFVPAGKTQKVCLVCWKEERGYKLVKADNAFRDLQHAFKESEELWALAVRDAEQAALKHNKQLQLLVSQLKAKLAIADARKTPAPATPSIAKDKVRDLLKLCHPDKHQNSPAATEITKWLLSLR